MKIRRWFLKVFMRSFWTQSLQSNCLPELDTVIRSHCSVHKDMVEEWIIKMNNGDVAGPSGLVSKIGNIARWSRIPDGTRWMNQVIKEEVIPGEYKREKKCL